MTTDEQIRELQRQVEEADASRRHAQEVSSELVKEKRALQRMVKETEGIRRDYAHLKSELSQRLRDLEEVCQTERELRDELSRLRAFTDSLSSKFWSYEQKMCAEARAGLTQDQRTGAAIVLHWLKEQFSAPQDHLVDATKMVEAETIASVTTWANETFGAATIRVQVERAKKEFDELLDLLVMSGGLDVDQKLAEEAADVCICLYRVIGTLDPEAINKKMAKNRARKWLVDGQGCAQHVGEE